MSADRAAVGGAEPGMPVLDPAGAEGIASALAALAEGAVIAVPTDTVYGLAARVDRPDALRAVFEAKGRPPGLALPVLVGAADQVAKVAAGWPAAATALAAHFWPGPLTLVVPALPAVGPLLGGDGVTVGVRYPDDGVVHALCAAAGPLAVTSANAHGEPPCASAAEVVAAFRPSAVAMVLDGGSCGGVPSTVVDCTGDPVRCLREGAVPWAAVLSTLGG
jgi:tRNA threonylcarbamoyl adenosine modification protein (Sua5/YciO/YrdC/YwlC family)